MASSWHSSVLWEAGHPGAGSWSVCLRQETWVTDLRSPPKRTSYNGVVQFYQAIQIIPCSATARSWGTQGTAVFQPSCCLTALPCTLPRVASAVTLWLSTLTHCFGASWSIPGWHTAGKFFIHKRGLYSAKKMKKWSKIIFLLLRSWVGALLVTHLTSTLPAVRTVSMIYSPLVSQDSQPRFHKTKNKI